MVELRDYQQIAIQSVFNEWNNGINRTLLVQATGTGKTVVFSEITRQLVEQGKNVLIIAHRNELLEQAQKKLLDCSGVESVLEKAFLHTAGSECQVTVASIQTIRSESRLKEFDPKHFDYIIIDEAHHAEAVSYQTVLDYFVDAKVLGVTATPFRSKGEGLSIFKSIAYEYSILDAVEDGYLSPIKAKLIPLEIDLSNVKLHQGDFDSDGLSSALDPYLDKIADVMIEECKGKKTVVFLPMIKTSQHFRTILTLKGLKADEINGQSTNRKEILEAFEKGDLDVLCNAMLLTEGWDCPAVDCIVNLRPTRSENLYTQIVGRGTRLYPNKENLLLLDFLWQTPNHNLCRPATLIAKSDAEEEHIQKALESGEEKDLYDLEADAKKDVREEREKTVRKQIDFNKDNEKEIVDPLKPRNGFIDPRRYVQWLNYQDLIHYVPLYPYNQDPVTKDQREKIESYGLDSDLVPDEEYASKLISLVQNRAKKGLASIKQVKNLVKYGFRDIEKMNFALASSLMGHLYDTGFKPRQSFYIYKDAWNEGYHRYDTFFNEYAKPETKVGNGLW